MKKLLIAALALGSITAFAASEFKLEASIDLSGTEAEILYHQLTNAKEYESRTLVVRESNSQLGENGYVQCVKHKSARNGTYECKIRSGVNVQVSNDGDIKKL